MEGATDLMLNAPTTVLGFIACMMGGVFYLVKIFLDMNKEIFKDALLSIREAVLNNTRALDGLQVVVASLVEELHDRHVDESDGKS